MPTLAAQVKAMYSPFYTAVQDPIAKALASHVVSGFSVLSVPADKNTGTNGGSGSSGSADSVSGAASDNGKQRQDAIIGVVSALGAIALLVLAFLVYRSIQRKKELAHRRLSDPIEDYAHQIPPAGRDFDQDSIGGQRRRSFYFAEDSLSFNQQQQEAQQFGGHAGGYNGDYVEVSRSSPTPGNMVQRRVVPNTISAPILQGSSMNW